MASTTRIAAGSFRKAHIDRALEEELEEERWRTESLDLKKATIMATTLNRYRGPRTNRLDPQREAVLEATDEVNGFRIKVTELGVNTNFGAAVREVTVSYKLTETGL